MTSISNISTQAFSPLVSIIVPVYNVEDYLAECLDSILGQTYTNFELILIDDGSKDQSKEICLDYEQRDSRIKFFSQENSGLSVTRNRGIDIAQGEFIMFVDSDDWLELNAVEECLRPFAQDTDIDIVEFGVFMNGEHDNLPDQTLDRDTRLFLYANSRQGHGFAANKIFRTTLLGTLKFPVGKFYEDTAFVLECYLKIKKYHSLHRSLYHYRRREGQITDGVSPRYLDLYYNINHLAVQTEEKNPQDLAVVNTRLVYCLMHPDFAFWTDQKLFEEWYPLLLPYIKEARRRPFLAFSKGNYLRRWLFLHFPLVYRRLFMNPTIGVGSLLLGVLTYLYPPPCRLTRIYTSIEPCSSHLYAMGGAFLLPTNGTIRQVA